MKKILFFIMITTSAIAHVEYRSEESTYLRTQACSIDSESAQCDNRGWISEGGCSVSCDEDESATCAPPIMNTTDCVSYGSYCACY